MKKTEKDLNKIKQDYQDLSIKLLELTDEEMESVVGGGVPLDIKIFEELKNKALKMLEEHKSIEEIKELLVDELSSKGFNMATIMMILALIRGIITGYGVN